MPKVVSNTTPIISLLNLDKLELLYQLYDQIDIPRAVYVEIQAGKRKGYFKDLSKLNLIKVFDVEDTKAIRCFLDLDAGEAEAIVLATEIEADLILLDEKLGRHYAKNAGLHISGTLGVLIKTKKRGVIDQLSPLLDELVQKHVWISNQLKLEILKEVGE